MEEALGVHIGAVPSDWMTASEKSVAAPRMCSSIWHMLWSSRERTYLWSSARLGMDANWPKSTGSFPTYLVLIEISKSSLQNVFFQIKQVANWLGQHWERTGHRPVREHFVCCSPGSPKHRSHTADHRAIVHLQPTAMSIGLLETIQAWAAGECDILRWYRDESICHISPLSYLHSSHTWFRSSRIWNSANWPTKLFPWGIPKSFHEVNWLPTFTTHHSATLLNSSLSSAVWAMVWYANLILNPSCSFL